MSILAPVRGIILRYRMSCQCPFAKMREHFLQIKDLILNGYYDVITTRTKKAQREPHLFSADHAVILGLANTLGATAEHHKMSSIKQGVCEGEVEYYF